MTTLPVNEPRTRLSKRLPQSEALRLITEAMASMHYQKEYVQ